MFFKKTGLKGLTSICEAKFIGRVTICLWNFNGCNMILYKFAICYKGTSSTPVLVSFLE